MTTKDCKAEVGVRENRSTFYFVCVRAWVVWGLGEVWWSREIEEERESQPLGAPQGQEGFHTLAC